MLIDVGTPIVSIGKSREEILLVDFDGFIKNPSEALIRTMLRDDIFWMERYPLLESFDDFDEDELYDNTMIFQPSELLYSLCEGNLSKEEIEEDVEEILSDVFIENSKITTFEFSLFQLLHERFIKRCYIFKETSFFDYEIQYIESQYSEVLDKIEIVSGGIITLFEEYKPTTIFTREKELIMKYFPEKYTPEELLGKMFILLNDTHNILFNDDNSVFEYRENFQKELLELNQSSTFVIGTMFNFALNTEDMEEMSNVNNLITETPYVPEEDVNEEDLEEEK